MASVEVRSFNMKRVFFGKVAYGSDLLEAIKSLIEANNIKTGIVLALGAVRKARIGYYDQSEKKYIEMEINEPLEIVSCLGNVIRTESETIVHLHVTLGRRNGTTIGGHLLSGTKVFSCEVSILELEGPKVTREFDELTGLKLIQFTD